MLDSRPVWCNTFDMKLSEELKWRGFINQTTYSDLSQLDSLHGQTFYMGFDASADSQTIGNLAAMMFVKTFLRHNRPGILVAGGSTSLIGDPGGKDTERPLQDEKTIASNIKNAEQQIKNILRGHKFKLVNNLEWTKNLNVLHFLRDIGKHFSMTPLIQRDYIAKRIGQDGSGISYAEFSYTVLQGYDYLHLHDKHGVTLQLGGSDQWGNCLSGVELIRRVRGKEVDVITMNLVINQATNKKFGKTEEGAIWLDAKKTTPTQFYQFWINADDKGVESYLKIYTELGRSEIDAIMDKHQKNPGERYAQQCLAAEATTLVHGEDNAGRAAIVSDVLTSKVPVESISSETARAISGEIPSITVKAGDSLIDILVRVGLAMSNTEARRLLSSGAIYLNGQPTSSEQLDGEILDGRYALLRRGKAYKDSALLELG